MHNKKIALNKIWDKLNRINQENLSTKSILSYQKITSYEKEEIKI